MTLMAVGLCAIIVLTFLDWRYLLALRADSRSNVHENADRLEDGLVCRLEASRDDADLDAALEEPLHEMSL